MSNPFRAARPHKSLNCEEKSPNHGEADAERVEFPNYQRSTQHVENGNNRVKKFSYCEKKKSNRAEVSNFGAIRFDLCAIRFDFDAIRFWLYETDFLPGDFPDEKGGNPFPPLEYKESRRRHKYGKENREQITEKR